MLEYIDQGVEDIRLHIVEGDYTLEQFTVLSARNFMWKDTRVDFAVLGESHLVSIRRGDVLFTEICACKAALFPKAITVHVSDQLTKIEKTPLVFKLASHDYFFKYDCVDYPAGKIQLRQLREQNNSTAQKISYEFPRHMIFSEKAVTEVYVRESLGGLHVQTVHTYPNKKKMVFTESFISLK